MKSVEDVSQEKQHRKLESMRAGWDHTPDRSRSVGDIVAGADEYRGGARFEAELPVEQLVESPWNPRKRFNPDSMRELEESVREKGVVTPLLVRPLGIVDGAPRYEIGAGHRRHRAARAAGRATVPAVVRGMSDAEFLELLIFENDQREDVHALEEAQGFQTLLEQPGYDVARIAARIGRSPKYVYDRLKLLQLVPEAQRLFLDGRMEAGHAILLARLGAKDQERAIDPGADALFLPEHARLFEEEDEPDTKDDRYAGAKACTIRELSAWIHRHVKFDRENVDPVLFPETAAALEEAQASSLKIIPITRSYIAHEDVRKASGERIYGEGAWERADGKAEPRENVLTGRRADSGGKTCDRSRLGVVVSGRGQGEAFRVCIDKEKCAVHWSAWQKERAKRQGVGTASTKHSAEQERKAEEQRKEAERKEQVMQARWKKATPAMLEALAAAVKKAPIGQLVKTITRGLRAPDGCAKLVPVGKTAEDFVRHLAMVEAADRSDQVWSYDRQRFAESLKAFGIDAMAVLNQAAPAAVQTSAKAAKPSGAAKKQGKKKAGRKA